MIWSFSRRFGVLAAGLAFGAAPCFATRLAAPLAGPLVIGLFAAMPTLCCGVLAFTLDKAGIDACLLGLAGSAIAALACAATVHDLNQIVSLFGFAAFALMIVGAYNLAKAAWRPRSLTRADCAAGVAFAGLLCVYCLYYIMKSRDLMFWDFMHYRAMSMLVASVLADGQFVALLKLFVNSIKDEYSILPALAPGAALAATSPLSRGCYEAAITVFYAAPAYLALGILARDLARPIIGRRALGQSRIMVWLFAALAAFSAYPTGMAVVARGMPDIGGLVLVVAGLRLCERLARLLALPCGHDAVVARLTRRVSLALALCLFGMFLFRRWYAFEAVGILATLLAEMALIVVARGFQFRWRQALGAAALAGLVLFTLVSPILMDWLSQPESAQLRRRLCGVSKGIFCVDHRHFRLVRRVHSRCVDRLRRFSWLRARLKAVCCG